MGRYLQAGAKITAVTDHDFTVLLQPWIKILLHSNSDCTSKSFIAVQLSTSMIQCENKNINIPLPKHSGKGILINPWICEVIHSLL